MVDTEKTISISMLQTLFTLCHAGSFSLPYEIAHKLALAERTGDPVDHNAKAFGAFPICIGCRNPWGIESAKPMICGRCKAVVYCSKDCQVKDWKGSFANDESSPQESSHKDLCRKYLEHMKLVPQFRAILQQFPWARVEADGTSSHDLVRARFAVLGSGTIFGYWSTPGIQDRYGRGLDSFDAAFHGLQLMAANAEEHQSYIDGATLLGTEWPTDAEGWAFEKEHLIPYLCFDDDHPMPEHQNLGIVKDWSSWYKWRRLTLQSPAALLMDAPLSVYHVLSDVLKVIDPEASSAKRQILRVSYLAPDVELNFLPLFSELALLFPNTDIVLTFYGKHVYDLVQKAHADHADSLATRDIVWSYSAPEQMGGGSIKIKLHSEAETWTRETLMALEDDEYPDALIGLNASLLCKDWGEPMIICAAANIPFAITEYTEEKLEKAACELKIIQRASLAQRHEHWDASVEDVVQSAQHPIVPNPFHRPGQRPVGFSRVPNLFNGFTMPVVLGTPCNGLAG